MRHLADAALFDAAGGGRGRAVGGEAAPYGDGAAVLSDDISGRAVCGGVGTETTGRPRRR